MHVVNSSTIQLKRNDAITEQVQFVRNAAGDRIIRTDGLNWADNGFAAGTLFIGGGGANSGTFTIASVSGSTLILTVANSVTEVTLTKTFDQPIIALAPNKGLSADPALNVGASDTHSLVNAKNLPIGGLQDGKTYYVRGVSGAGDDTFELWNAPSGGSQIVLTPTGLAGPYGNHSLAALAIDISDDVDSEQQLRIDISDGATSAAPGQFLFGPGEVPLSEIAPQSGDGVSSAYAKGSGGGFVGVQINDADIISNPNVSATISATQITTVGDVTVSTSATTNTSSYAVNGTGGFVAIGDADARSFQDITSAATISDNTRTSRARTSRGFGEQRHHQRVVAVERRRRGRPGRSGHRRADRVQYDVHHRLQRHRAGRATGQGYGERLRRCDGQIDCLRRRLRRRRRRHHARQYWLPGRRSGCRSGRRDRLAGGQRRAQRAAYLACGAGRQLPCLLRQRRARRRFLWRRRGRKHDHGTAGCTGADQRGRRPDGLGRR
ncbi:hypothetical protein AJ88_20830 [Mesorhizobium amorphae CCBAU 01583]|nr:hypothetical protein AJ88_20830 [Mesorhizobium amorphae CCBAU 01583]